MFPTRRITLGGDVFRDEYSLAFDGIDGYVDCGNDSSLTVGTSDFTACAWVKLSSKGGSSHHDVIAKGDTLSDGNGWGVNFNENSNRIYLDIGNDSNNRENVTSGTNVWEYGKWYYVAVSRVNSTDTMNIYLDGLLIATQSSRTNDDIADSSSNFRIGNSDDERFANGNVSDVAYYNTALTASQVKTIYNGREPYNHKEGVASSNLVGWWRMGDGLENHSGSTIYDMSVNSNNGTMTNMSVDDFIGDTP